ncbi:conserved membrane hypothetical protein [Candidatus Roizmanbacteria bacterium]|nr:conserved membrane hypothetical protein [Candidatus Roizmanbacteria bacterium]
MKKILMTLAIILLAFFFRFNSLNWDQNLHLHPDERFLTMVGNAMKLPTNINQYFDQKTSLMNPTNIGYNFFVYGRFPLILTKYLAVVYNLDNYNDFTILGRQLSAFFDLLIIFFIIKTVGLLEKKLKLKSSIKYWAGFFYAIAVLPIQLSHFFAVDTFLNFFMFGSFYFALRKKNIFSAVFFGLALASKITALFILPLNLFIISLAYLQRPSRIGKYLLMIFIYLGISYFTLRLADPYLFQNSNIFNPTISKLFIENIKSLQNMTVKNMSNWFPPMVQWLNKNTTQHSLVNNIVFGLGIPYVILLITGILRVLLSFLRKRESIPIFAMLFWSLSFFAYQSIQVTPTLRYFIIIYPFLAIFASIGINYLINFKIKLKGKYLVYSKTYSYFFIFISILILLIWPLMFSSIYLNKNSRVEASEWIYKNLPNNSMVLGESWDDSLPMGVVNNYGKQFTSDQLPVFEPDTPEKWQKMNDLLMRADYYVLSSNRGWGSIMTVPEKYPKMTQFYKLLLSNNLQYKKIKEFNSFPKLKIKNWKLFEINDSWSDEGFTVYDHPQVLIYKNERHSSRTF